MNTLDKFLIIAHLQKPKEKCKNMNVVVGNFVKFLFSLFNVCFNKLIRLIPMSRIIK